MIKTAVIGHPIKHSKSPLIHNYWMGKYNLAGSYEAIDIAPRQLVTSVQALIDDGYAGFNVTVPHKEEIMKLCDTLDDTATAIGAVNTVIIKNGKLHGRNTDAFGFIQNIKDNAPDFIFKGKTALILGAGGAAKACVYGLLQEGCEIIISNRTREKAEQLVSFRRKPESGCLYLPDSGLRRSDPEVIDWNNKESVLAGIDLLINTTSLGMDGKPPLEVSLDHLNPEALVNDIVYAPLMTPLLCDAQERGNTVITGIGMLLQQARPAFESWYGTMPDIDAELERLVLA